MIAMFQEDPTLQEHNVEVDATMTKIDGKRLAAPQILEANGRRKDFKAFVDKKVMIT